ncbi:hypothetical protein V2L00_13630 [Pseudomonas alliivorans]|nr:hypothetical protein [Pseudomonas alliivorans]
MLALLHQHPDNFSAVTLCRTIGRSMPMNGIMEPAKRFHRLL